VAEKGCSNLLRGTAAEQEGIILINLINDLELAEKAEKQIGGEGGEANMNANEINGIEAEEEGGTTSIPLGIERAAPRSVASAGAPASSASQRKERTRRVGGRAFKRLESEVDIACDGPWLLVAVPQWSREGWLSLKLFRNAEARKRCWYLGVKNGLMARNTDAALLAAHHPELVAWIVECATAYQTANYDKL
jgi:hypothetical protein